jgi:hypothetical protein
LPFNPTAYGPHIAEILALDQDGERLIPLVSGNCSSLEARSRLTGQRGADLFPQAFAPDAALAGLWLYFSCLDECHQLAQDIHSPEGSFWHAILHRQEPDSGNAAYWFRRVGQHPLFPELCHAAGEIIAQHPDAEFRTGGKWDPFSFVMFCERARQQPNSPSERTALEIQRVEWQLLFDRCARPRS